MPVRKFRSIEEMDGPVWQERRRCSGLCVTSGD